MFLHYSFVFTETASFELEFCEFEHDEKIFINKDFSQLDYLKTKLFLEKDILLLIILNPFKTSTFHLCSS